MSSPRRHRPCSPAAAPLDDDDLLSEILLRLPPLPSSLPRASAVCKRWRLLVSDPGFLRRFRIHHRRNPPLLGFFRGLEFIPSMEAHNRVPPGRFSFQRDRDSRYLSLGCRHGLVLISDLTQNQFVVWDPVTGDQHRVASPPGFDPKTTQINGSVVRDAGDVHFQVVFVGSRHNRALACVYSSETGVWGDIASTLVPAETGPFDFMLRVLGARIPTEPAVLVGGSLYWIFLTSAECNSYSILEFDLRKHSLAVVPMPFDVFKDALKFTVIRADGGGLGFLFVSDFTAQLWKRDPDGVASWVLDRTIELDKLLSLNSEVRDNIRILGFAEENNAVFLRAYNGLYEVQLQSLQFKLFRKVFGNHFHPFESVYTAETDIGGEHNIAELLHYA